MKKILFVLILIGLVAGCASTEEDEALVAANLQSEQAHIALLNKKIAAHGINVIQNDTAMMIILPCARTFNPSSANFSREAYDSLSLVAELVSRYDPSVVEVSGFTDYRKCCAMQKVLAERRGQVVAKYLWDHDINASFIYAEGREATIVRHRKGIITDCIVINFRML
jgi:outer membrane protein OmpA-like peptidoglycan-associated protein